MALLCFSDFVSLLDIASLCLDIINTVSFPTFDGFQLTRNEFFNWRWETVEKCIDNMKESVNNYVDKTFEGRRHEHFYENTIPALARLLEKHGGRASVSTTPGGPYNLTLDVPPQVSETAERYSLAQKCAAGALALAQTFIIYSFLSRRGGNTPP